VSAEDLATWLAVGALAACAASDVAARRVPNGLVVLVALMGLTGTALASGLLSVIASLAVGVAALAVLLLPWKLGYLGGGDAKLAAAAACAVGPRHLFVFAIVSALAGGLLALYVWVFAPARTRTSIAAGLYSLAPSVVRAVGPQPASPLPRRVPFALAIALGATWVLLRR
jgi:prepilin peptidase CpaA